jgi:hypothetical protein
MVMSKSRRHMHRTAFRAVQVSNLTRRYLLVYRNMRLLRLGLDGLRLDQRTRNDENSIFSFLSGAF